MPFVNACSKFLYLENLGVPQDTEQEPQSSEEVPRSGKDLRGDAKLVNLLRNAVEACDEGDGWRRCPASARISAIRPRSTSEISATGNWAT